MKTITKKPYKTFEQMAGVFNAVYIQLLLERGHYSGVQHSNINVITELVVKLAARLEDFTSSAGET